MNGNEGPGKCLLLPWGLDRASVACEKFPVNEAATQSMTEFHNRVSAALGGERALSVKAEPRE
jgi:hypothetical protein